MAKAFNIPRKDIEVVIPYIGGALEGRQVYTEPLVAVLSKAAKGRPVKLKMTRKKNLITTYQAGCEAEQD